MAISTRTDLGNVKISDQVAASIILYIFDSADMSEKIWPASERGREFGRTPRILDSDSDFASTIQTNTDESGDLTIEFSVIVRFGVSIKALTRELSDRIAERLQYILGIKPSKIIINIAGVKSRHIAARNTRTIYRYDKENKSDKTSDES